MTPSSPLAGAYRTLLGGACAALLATPASAIDLNFNKLVETAKTVAKVTEPSRMSEPEEITVGKDIAARTLSAYPLVRKEKLQRYVNQVGRWVAQQSDRPALPWRFAVVQSDQINAFAVPGGAVLITTGMMQSVANEAELACVLGHEIGHIARKHHLALLEKAAMLEAGSQAISDNINNADKAKGAAKQWLVKEGAELFTRALDRGAERDADGDGLVLAARAGYDPAACLLFMERLAARKLQDNGLAALYKTHPPAGERLTDLTGSIDRLEGAAAGDGARPSLQQRD